MSPATIPDGRVRAYVQFLAALFYYFLARILARHAATGFATDSWGPLLQQAMLVFLLILGYAGMGMLLNRRASPISEQGLTRRQGWLTEASMGVAAGWAASLLCVIALVVGGGIAIRLFTGRTAWGWLLADAIYFVLLVLAEEVAFRGYAFQRFARAVGPAGAAIGFAALYAFLQALQIGSTHASIAVSFVLTLVLSTAYFRTRALWVSWGINFGWKACRALIFGLTVSGISNHSPVIQGDPMGSFWLTGGGYGLDGSWFAFVVLLALLPVVYRITRDLDYRYNVPQFIPGGIPVDLDAAARRQHEAAMGPAEPAVAPLVQIIPLPPLPPAQNPEPPTIAGNDSE